MKTYELKATKHPDVFRVVDRDGNWENYYVKSKNVYLPGVTTILNRGYAKGAFFEQWLSQHTAEERDQILRAAGEKGDKVHRAIDLMLTAQDGNAQHNIVRLDNSVGILNRETKDYEPLSNEEWDALLAFASFWKAHEPQVLASEATLYNSRYGFAGTTDAIFTITKSCEVKTCRCESLVGKIGLWDWKSSKGIRPSYSAQIGAYANAENLSEYLPIGKTFVDYTAILRIGTNHKTTGGYELKSFDFGETADSFARFIAAKAIADFDHRPFNPDEDIQEIPDTIELAVTQFDFKAANAKVNKVENKPTNATNGKSKRSGGKAARAPKAKAGN